MLSKLTALIPIPTVPIDTIEKRVAAGSKAKRAAAGSKALAVRLPTDFLEYSRTYGTGTISCEAYSWEIYSAFRPTFPALVAQFFDCHDSYRRAMEESLPLGLFPEPGGLLPFGGRDRVSFCWRTVGEPDDWTVCVLWEYRKGGFQLFDLNFSGFLFSLLTRKIKVAGYQSKWNPKKDITFESEVYGG